MRENKFLIHLFVDLTSTPTTSFSGRRIIKRTIKRKRLQNNALSRKRQRNELEWIDNHAKQCRASGKQGEGRKTIIEAKSIKPACSSTCYLKCTSKMTDEDRSNAFNEYYSLANKTKQWQCISNWVVVKKSKEPDEEAIELAKIYDKTLKEKQRYDFSLPSSNGSIHVCRTMFVNTLGTLNFRNLLN